MKKESDWFSASFKLWDGEFVNESGKRKNRIFIPTILEFLIFRKSWDITILQVRFHLMMALGKSPLEQLYTLLIIIRFQHMVSFAKSNQRMKQEMGSDSREKKCECFGFKVLKSRYLRRKLQSLSSLCSLSSWIAQEFIFLHFINFSKKTWFIPSQSSI